MSAAAAPIDLCIYILSPNYSADCSTDCSSGGLQTSTHSALTNSAMRAGAILTALRVEPAAGTTSSKSLSETSQKTGKGEATPNGHTPPTACPVTVRTSS